MSSSSRFLASLIVAFLCTLSSCCNRSTDVTKIKALDDKYWAQSEWISATDAQVLTERSELAPDGSSWFVYTLQNDKKVKSAKWMTTGLGIYQLYVNGKIVGEEVLKPGFTHPLKTKRSFTYDISPLFKNGKHDINTLSAQVTPGWWADRIVTPGHIEGTLGKKCAFRSVLELSYTDGTIEIFGTDTLNWKAGIAGPVKHAGIYDGEEYDAREKLGFECIDQLGTPEINNEFQGEILPSEGAEVYLRYDLSLKPVMAYVWKDVEGKSETAHGRVIKLREYQDGEQMLVRAGENLVIDFGQNCSAVPVFEFQAEEGTTLTCLPGEILNDGNGAFDRGMDGPEGSVHRENLRLHQIGIRVVYTFADSDDFVKYMPICTFFGYRYITISTTDDVRIKSIKSLPISSISKELEIGHISTGNELINRLISNAYWGQLSNYLSIPTDCPQRNERQGWTADTQVYAETGSFFANSLDFFHKWMRDLRDGQTSTGAFPAIAPNAQLGGRMMRLGWADAGVIVPWTMWKQYGDTKIIEENWQAMKRFMYHVYESKYDHTTLAEENGGRQYADWLSYEPLESHLRLFNQNEKDDRLAYWNYLGASYWAIDAAMMRDMAQAINEDSGIYQAMHNEAVQYLKNNFMHEDGRFRNEIFNTMQTPALFALKNGIVDGQAKENMIKRLRENFKAHENCLQTGFLGTSILMPVLTENGMQDIAYELLFQRKNPSWLYSVDNGATTIWERWNSYTLEKGMGPKDMNSFNHYAYGCVCEWIWETAAGIASDPKAPGFKHIIMKPIPDKRLGYVTAEYKSASGLIKSSWKYEGSTWKWDISIPEGSTAFVTLPGETEVKEYTSGEYSFSKDI